jgi:glycosyltransferase involved in cell wall biosynthesis
VLRWEGRAAQRPSLSAAGMEATWFAKRRADLDREIAPEMHRLLKQWALPNVRVLGQVQKGIAPHLFVFPSVNEGLARVLFEAMACGLPVIATERSGAEDCITQGVEGNVTPARSVEAMAEAILWRSAAMGNAARARIERQFTLPHYVDRVIGIYRAAVEKTSFPHRSGFAGTDAFDRRKR